MRTKIIKAIRSSIPNLDYYQHHMDVSNFDVTEYNIKTFIIYHFGKLSFDLLKGGFKAYQAKCYTSMQVIARSIYEYFIVLEWIMLNPQKHSMVYFAKGPDSLQKLRNAAVNDPKIRKYLKKQFKTEFDSVIKSKKSETEAFNSFFSRYTNARIPDKEQMARKLKISQTYTTLYRTLCTISHPDPYTVSSFFDFQNGKIVHKDITYDPDYFMIYSFCNVCAIFNHVVKEFGFNDKRLEIIDNFIKETGYIKNYKIDT